ncbi:MAG TPA: ATP-binding protein [Pyrinomonadaceae bacterium]|jgi:hypothetical protein
MRASKKQLANSDGNGFAAAGSGVAQGPPFGDIPATPASHFDLYFLAATAALVRRLTPVFGTREAVYDEYPFLRIYDERLAGREPDCLADDDAADWWEKNLLAWEKNGPEELPLRRLREKLGLGFAAVVILLTVGLIEEDARFGAIFETLNEFSTEKRPTYGTLNCWLKNDGQAAPDSLFELHGLGLLRFGGVENPRSEWTLAVEPLLWDALRGEKLFLPADWLQITAAENLPAAGDLILGESLKREIARLPALFESEMIRTVIVRGARRNSRRTILGALAGSLGLGLLEIKPGAIGPDERWKIVNTLAVLRRAMPVLALDAAPGETIELPGLLPAIEACGVTLGKQGGVGGAAIEKAITLTVPLPDEAARRAHWRDCAEPAQLPEIDEISRRFRLSGGNIRRAAALARSFAALANRRRVSIADVRQATRALNRQSLDTLANYLEPLAADWNLLAVREETLSELRQLESRCRVRENLGDFVGKGLRGQLQAGVRALFNGASGTGKTYAARLLAGALEKDIYRLDLSAIINKYIGETEKNLARVFAFVEELDVILLLDEGDSLLTARTGVANANDRYANLETNYLLQRLETFEGILIVTTNASDRIDSAFARRMDTIVEFAAPEAAERRRIWRLHLPETNDLPPDFFEEIVGRCRLSGGQIRNVALHAAALALGAGKPLGREHVEPAVRREYRKTGAICPLREDGDLDLINDRW